MRLNKFLILLMVFCFSASLAFAPPSLEESTTSSGSSSSGSCSNCVNLDGYYVPKNSVTNFITTDNECSDDSFSNCYRNNNGKILVYGDQENVPISTSEWEGEDIWDNNVGTKQGFLLDSEGNAYSKDGLIYIQSNGKVSRLGSNKYNVLDGINIKFDDVKSIELVGTSPQTSYPVVTKNDGSVEIGSVKLSSDEYAAYESSVKGGITGTDGDKINFLEGSSLTASTTDEGIRTLAYDPSNGDGTKSSFSTLPDGSTYNIVGETGTYTTADGKTSWSGVSIVGTLGAHFFLVSRDGDKEITKAEVKISNGVTTTSSDFKEGTYFPQTIETTSSSGTKTVTFSYQGTNYNKIVTSDSGTENVGERTLNYKTTYGEIDGTTISGGGYTSGKQEVVRTVTDEKGRIVAVYEDTRSDVSNFNEDIGSTNDLKVTVFSEDGTKMKTVKAGDIQNSAYDEKGIVSDDFFDEDSYTSSDVNRWSNADDLSCNVNGLCTAGDQTVTACQGLSTVACKSRLEILSGTSKTRKKQQDAERLTGDPTVSGYDLTVARLNNFFGTYQEIAGQFGKGKPISNLLFGEIYTQQLTASIDRWFSGTVLSQDYWESAICAAKRPDIQDTGYAFIETPAGTTQAVASIQAEYSGPGPILCEFNEDEDDYVCKDESLECLDGSFCYDDNEEIAQGNFYKITWGVAAPADEKQTPYVNEDGIAVTYNIVVCNSGGNDCEESSDDGEVRIYEYQNSDDAPLKLQNGERDGAIIVQWSSNEYDTACIEWGAAPITVNRASDNNRNPFNTGSVRGGQLIPNVCGPIVESSQGTVDVAIGSDGSGTTSLSETTTTSGDEEITENSI